MNPKKKDAHLKRLNEARQDEKPETHMQVMRRLGLDGNFVFRHGKPGEPHKKHQRS